MSIPMCACVYARARHPDLFALCDAICALGPTTLYYIYTNHRSIATSFPMRAMTEAVNRSSSDSNGNCDDCKTSTCSQERNFKSKPNQSLAKKTKTWTLSVIVIIIIIILHQKYAIFFVILHCITMKCAQTARSHTDVHTLLASKAAVVYFS